MSATETQAHINNLVLNNDIVIFMKGVPTETSCGYSSRAIQILNHCGANYVYQDILSSDELRKGVKTYSGIKTLPQIFVKGEYFGGSDDIREMFETGQLASFFQKKHVSLVKNESQPNLVLSNVTVEEITSCGKTTAPRRL